MPYMHIVEPPMPTAPSGVCVRAGLYFGTFSRCSGLIGIAQGADR